VTRSIFSLMLLVALTGLVMSIMRETSRWQVARSTHLAIAAQQAKHLQLTEAALKGATDTHYRAWLSAMADHHRDLERKHLRAAERPWEAMTPDPHEPAPPIEQILGALQDGRH
jgi:hypothetical protein